MSSFQSLFERNGLLAQGSQFILERSGIPLIASSDASTFELFALGVKFMHGWILYPAP